MAVPEPNPMIFSLPGASEVIELLLKNIDNIQWTSGVNFISPEGESGIGYIHIRTPTNFVSSNNYLMLTTDNGALTLHSELFKRDSDTPLARLYNRVNAKLSEAQAAKIDKKMRDLITTLKNF